MLLHSAYGRGFTRCLSLTLISGLALVVPVLAQTRPNPSSISQMSLGQLALSSSHVGTLFVDGERRIAITPNRIVTLRLVAGEHFVELRDTKGVKLWTKVVNIPAGTQVAESITLGGKSSVSVGDGSEHKPELTQCEELTLLNRFQEAVTACGEDRARDFDYSLQLDFSSYLIGAKLGVDYARKAMAEYCDPAGKNFHHMKDECTWARYQLGEYAKVLSASNEVVEELTQAVQKLQEWRRSGNPISISNMELELSLGQSYRFRSIVKYALADRIGALTDVQSALDHFSVFRRYLGTEPRKQPDDIEIRRMSELLASQSATAHLNRSLILYRSGRYEEAVGDFNEYTANAPLGYEPNLDRVRKRLGVLIKAAVTNRVLASDRQQSPSVAGSFRDEIEEAENSGRTLPLPNSSPCGKDGSLQRDAVRYEVKNSTLYDLRLIVSGPVEQEMRISANASQSIIFPAGTYKILGKVASAAVRPFFGHQTFLGGMGCASEFYITAKP